MNGGAWWAAVHGIAKSQTGLSDFTFTFHFHTLEKEREIEEKARNNGSILRQKRWKSEGQPQVFKSGKRKNGDFY